MPCLCSDSVHLFQVRIPAACAANLRHHAPKCRESPRYLDSRSANCTTECPSYNPCTLCMVSAPRASDAPTLCSDPAPPQECRICRMSRPACSILLLLLLMLKLLLLLLLLLLCWLFAWPLGRVGSLHRVNESEALGAESMHRVHRSCRWAFRWCKSRFWNHDFGVIPCILEHGASD